MANPAPNSDKPAPAAAVPAPNKAIAAAKPKSPGNTGVINIPAAPRTANAPANANNEVPISARLSLLNFIICGVNTANAADITNIAAAPANPPVIPAIAAANINSEPANATKLLPISSHD